MNVCKFSTSELNELDQVIKRELRQKNAGKAGERQKIILEEGERRKRVEIVERHIQRDQIACCLLHG